MRSGNYADDGPQFEPDCQRFKSYRQTSATPPQTVSEGKRTLGFVPPCPKIEIPPTYRPRGKR